MSSVYDFSLKRITGENQSLGEYDGKVLLIVNVASKCGLTPHYNGLQKLYEQYALERSVMGFLNPRNLGGMLEARKLKVGGMSPDGPMDRIPGDFLIGPDGKLVDVFYGSAIGDHIPFERVDAFMAR